MNNYMEIICFMIFAESLQDVAICKIFANLSGILPVMGEHFEELLSQATNFLSSSLWRKTENVFLCTQSRGKMCGKHTKVGGKMCGKQLKVGMKTCVLVGLTGSPT